MTSDNQVQQSQREIHLEFYRQQDLNLNFGLFQNSRVGWTEYEEVISNLTLNSVRNNSLFCHTTKNGETTVVNINELFNFSTKIAPPSSVKTFNRFEVGFTPRFPVALTASNFVSFCFVIILNSLIFYLYCTSFGLVRK